MDCCRCNCSYVAVIVAILAGVALGVLYALGLLATGIIFWAYLALGVAGILLSPLYATVGHSNGGCRCYCRYRLTLLIAAIGTIITAVIGLIVVPIAGVVVVGIVVGVATLFAVLQLGGVVCLTNCLCEG